MSEAKVAGSIPADKKEHAPPKERPVGIPKPTKALPTDRISFSKQMDILRGFAALVAQGTAAPTAPGVADVVGLHRNTAALAVPFLVDVGFLARSGDGYLPAQEVLAYGKAHNWNADTAPHKLAPVLRRSWFAQALLPKLTLSAMNEKKALELLGVASGADPKYEPQMKTLLQYLVVSAVIRREGDMIRAGDSDEVVAQAPSENGTMTKDAAAAKDSVRAAGITTAYAQVPEGVLRFSVDVNVDLKEFSTWRPDRINAFWAGIAQVLAAKAAVEATSSD